MASGTRIINYTTYDSPPPSPQIARAPTAGTDTDTMETHRLIQERAKKLAEVPSLQGRVSTQATSEKTPRGRADLSTSSESVGSSLSVSGSASDIENQGAVFNSSFSTPTSSPVKEKKELKTPEALKVLDTAIAGEDFGFDLTPESHKSVTQAVEKLDELNSPYRSEQKDKVRSSFSAALKKTGSTSEIPTLAPRILFSADKPADIRGKWTVILARSLDVSFVDADHLKNLQEGGGFHVCSADHPLDPYVRSRRINLKTGVWCGKVFDPTDSQKVAKSFSSFVPREMTLEQYKILIAEAQGNDDREIARQDNRRLYEVVDGKNRFMIECYRQLSDTLIRSAIPIFHYEVYEGTETSFEVDYSFKLTRDGDDPLKQLTYIVDYKTLFELLQTKPKAILYNTDDKIIVDVGLLFDNCPIDQGLLVEISKEFLI